MLPDTGTNRLSFPPYLDAEEFSRGYVRGVDIVNRRIICIISQKDFGEILIYSISQKESFSCLQLCLFPCEYQYRYSIQLLSTSKKNVWSADWDVRLGGLA